MLLSREPFPLISTTPKFINLFSIGKIKKLDF